jgi:hypothetical protein
MSERRDSNSRPQPWQGCALPTELLSHGIYIRGRERIRTAVRGFADLCLAARPPDPMILRTRLFRFGSANIKLFIKPILFF